MTIVASRQLRLRLNDGEVEVPVKLFAPEQTGRDWTCPYEIGWPEGAVRSSASGFDAMQALVLALQKVGAELYASNYHRAGLLAWDKPGNGYGFPLPQNARGWLEGDDARFF